MAIIHPASTLYPGTSIWPSKNLGGTVAALNPLRLAGIVSGSNIQDYTGSGLGGTVS